MERLVGTISRGIRGPIIRENDDISEIVVDCMLKASESEGFSFRDRDVIAMTEAVVARSQGNYANVDQIAKDIKQKYPSGVIGLTFPILSRNRFAICLKGIAKGAKKIILMLSYPSDEVGNHLISLDQLDEKHINPWTDVLTEKEYRDLFGYQKHHFTGVDYVEYYHDLIESVGCQCEIIFANDVRTILNYTDNVLCCDIHTRARSKRLLKEKGVKIVYGLDDVLSSSVDGSGYNELYGLLGSNKASEDRIKLFPRDGQKIVEKVQKMMLEKTGKHVEVMIYGDGAFKDPVGKIWELADPVCSPFYTKGLNGQPNEVKLKYLADNDFASLNGKELQDAISDYIRKKDSNLKGQMISEGTTPRQLTDLIGSLCDLTSGSGDKGTPFILVQGYFDNYTN